MNFNFSSRQFLSAVIILFYLVPILLLTHYSIGLMSSHKSWSILSIGLLVTASGALTLVFLLFYWEQTLKERIESTDRTLSLQFLDKESIRPPLYLEKETKVTSIDPLLLNPPENPSLPQEELLEATLKEYQGQEARLLEEIQIKDQAMTRLTEENKQLMGKVEQTAQDFADYKIFSEEQLKQKNWQMGTFQQTIKEQQAELENQQEQIRSLETKVQDLSYEIKTLLYLQDSEPAFKSPQVLPSPKGQNASLAPKSEVTHNEFELLVQTSTEAEALLKRCLGIAQKLVGTPYYGNESSRYREFSSPYHTIDQRRLFDSLRHETDGLIIVYSLREQKLVFVNQQSKTIFGWSPERFMQDFAAIIKGSLAEWQKALTALNTCSEFQIRLLVKTREGQESLLNCRLGQISAGLFKNYIIGILYPA